MGLDEQKETETTEERISVFSVFFVLKKEFPLSPQRAWNDVRRDWRGNPTKWPPSMGTMNYVERLNVPSN